MTSVTIPKTQAEINVKDTTIKIPKDYKKISRTRKQRGYNFEYSIVNAFNDHHSKQWYARRLGGSSTGLPDIVATNKAKSLLYAIEAKSGEGNILYIERDQIERCLDITEKFLTAYRNRYIVFAFKFKGKKGGRKLQYRFLLMSSNHLGEENLPKHLKGVSYDIRTETLNTHQIYEDYPICLPTFGKTLSIMEFVNQI